MRKRFLITFAGLCLALAIAGCALEPEAPAETPAPSGRISSMERYNSRYHPAHVSSAEAWALMQENQGALIIDLRSEASYQQSHVAGAVNVDYEALSSYAATNLPDKDRVIVCYCFCGDQGGEALSAYHLLTDLGYTQVFYTEPEDEWTYEGTAVTQDNTEDFMHNIISGAQAMQIYRENPDVLLLDVRNQDEYDAGHIESSTLIPVSELEERLAELPQKDALIIVYCRSGMRSATAYKLLWAQGYENLFDMQAVSSWPEPLVQE